MIQAPRVASLQSMSLFHTFLRTQLGPLEKTATVPISGVRIVFEPPMFSLLNLQSYDNGLCHGKNPFLEGFSQG
jgi:hypothetical protein